MDDAVGMVVEEMKSQGLFDNSIIVFSADVSTYNRAKWLLAITFFNKCTLTKLYTPDKILL